MRPPSLASFGSVNSRSGSFRRTSVMSAASGASRYGFDVRLTFAILTFVYPHHRSLLSLASLPSYANSAAFRNSILGAREVRDFPAEQTSYSP